MGSAMLQILSRRDYFLTIAKRPVDVGRGLSSASSTQD